MTRWLIYCAGLVLLAAPSLAEERKVVREVIELEDCPHVQVLGSGGVKMLSLSPRGFLGVEASNLTPELRRHFGVDEDRGVLVSRVVEDSAASAAGLRVGDVVTVVGGEVIGSSSHLGRAIRRLEGGATVDVEYWRDGSPSTVTATIEERERCSFDLGDYLHTLDLDSLDFEALDLDELPRLGDLGFAISGETLESAMESVRDALESQDWESHLQHLQNIDLEGIEDRMEEVQERLQELETRLERELGREQRSEKRRERDRQRSERDRDPEEP